MNIPCFSFVGQSGVGKTTVLERLVELLVQRGYRVAVIKHTRHTDIEIDAPGKDTRRFWDAGATQTMLVTPDRVVCVMRAVHPAVSKVLATTRDVDVVLVEGDKLGPLPKIEVIRAVCTDTPLPGITGRVACVTDVHNPDWGWPCFALDDGAALADYVQAWITAAQVDVGAWEELEHTADLALRVHAPDLQGLFVAAARGVSSLGASVLQVPLTRVVSVTLDATDREALLVDWLNELLYLGAAGAEQWSYVAFRFDVLTETTLRATALGALVMECRNAVKAVTFHDLVIHDDAMGFEATLVVDV